MPAASAWNTFPLQAIPLPHHLLLGLNFFSVYVTLLLLVSFSFFVSGNTCRLLLRTTAGDVFRDSPSGSPSRGLPGALEDHTGPAWNRPFTSVGFSVLYPQYPAVPELYHVLNKD